MTDLRQVNRAVGLQLEYIRDAVTVEIANTELIGGRIIVGKW